MPGRRSRSARRAVMAAIRAASRRDRHGSPASGATRHTLGLSRGDHHRLPTHATNTDAERPIRLPHPSHCPRRPVTALSHASVGPWLTFRLRHADPALPAGSGSAVSLEGFPRSVRTAAGGTPGARRRRSEESAGAEYQCLRLRGGAESNGIAGSARMASAVAAYSGISSLSRSSVYASDPSGRPSGASMPMNVTGSSGNRPFHVITSARARHRSTR